MVEKRGRKKASWRACCIDRVSTLETVGSIPLSGVDPIGRLLALSMLKRSIHTTLSREGDAGRLWEDSTGQDCHVEAVGPWSCVCEHEDHGPSHRGQASSVSTRAEALAIEWYAGGLDATTPVVSQRGAHGSAVSEPMWFVVRSLLTRAKTGAENNGQDGQDGAGCRASCATGGPGGISTAHWQWME